MNVCYFLQKVGVKALWFCGFLAGCVYYTSRELRDWEKLGYMAWSNWLYPVIACSVVFALLIIFTSKIDVPYSVQPNIQLLRISDLNTFPTYEIQFSNNIVKLNEHNKFFITVITQDETVLKQLIILN